MLNTLEPEMENAERSTLTTQSNDISDLIDKLNIIGEQFELGGTRQYSWRKEENGKIIKALEGTRDEYVNVEKTFKYVPISEGNKPRSKTSTSTSTSTSISNSASNPNNPIIYERDATGEIKKLTILDSGTVIDYNSQFDELYQTPTIKQFKINFSALENPTKIPGNE